MATPRSKPTFHILLFALLTSLLGSMVFVTPAYAAGITVNSSADTSADDGVCTLREAIANANSDSQLYVTAGECGIGSGSDIITFDLSLSGGTIYLQSVLTLSSNITIDGSGLTSQITISGDSDNNGNGDVRVFSIGSGTTVTLDSLAITKGRVSGNPGGGGIYNASGATLTITNSTLSYNTNSSGPGGGIRNDGTLTVMNSTFSGNTTISGGSGGGIRNIGVLTVTNSTFSGNSAFGSGGGIYNVIGFTSVTIINSTFSGNAAGSLGGGIYFDGGTLNYANTIIANSTSGGDCAGSGTIGTNTNNLVEDGGCSASLSGDPALDSLGDNGGPTQTFALFVDSLAIDAGDNTTCAASPVSNLDQRGVSRLQGVQCDIGAFEAEFVTVTTSADPGDGTCDATCSLRDAIAAVGADNMIIFDPSLSGATIHLASTLTIAQNMTIDGSALASKITVSGDSDSNGTGDVRVFFVHSGTTVTLDSLIITKGNGTALSSEGITGGGGIQNNSGNNAGAALTVINSTISDNSADNGGGILNSNGSTLRITNSTISDNTATGNGGGILSDGNLLAITNSTLSGNSAADEGGGVRNGNIMTLTNSTISGNSASSGGGIRNAGSLTAKNNTLSGNSASVNGGGIYSDNTFNATNNIIANSTSGGDCNGQIDTNVNNLVEDGSCTDNGVNFLTGDPQLDYLDDNGGPTQTIALLSGSPAIDVGDTATCAASPVNNLDQRNVTRPVGSQCDIGAYEGSKDISAPTVDSFTATSPYTSLNIPITAFTASDNVTVTGYKITETSTPPSSSADGWTASAPSNYTVGSDGSYMLYPWAKDAAGNVSAVFGSPASVTVDTTLPTIISITCTSSNPTSANSVDFTVTFSEPVTDVDVSDFTLTTTGLTNASVSAVSGSDTSYTVTASTGSNSGTLRLDVINPVSITDLFSNSLGSLPFTSGETYTIDRTAPTVTSIIRISADPTSASSVDFSVTFSEPVTDVDVFDFALTTTGLINTSISAVSGSGNSYTVTALTGYKSGTLRLDVSTTATITDLFSYSLVDLPFITGEVYTIEKTPLFIDVPFDYWSWQYIESIYNASITYGCSSNPLSYCPTNSVTRAQMAVFLLKGIHGSSYIPPAVDSETGFTDVPTDYWAAAWIKQLAAEGITSGCDMEIYCPETPVTRDQMAVFLLKAKYGTSYAPPAVGVDTGFTDVPSDYWAAAWIKQLAAEAITGGCGGGLYCPVNSVTRDQMAVFLQKTFGLPLP
ncbi:MAG: CSLREA domain-containing protein [Anaerolineales bacterium]|nr:CSLREA domain-containing protein [Anaerolineales bacterium]